MPSLTLYESNVSWRSLSVINYRPLAIEPEPESTAIAGGAWDGREAAELPDLTGMLVLCVVAFGLFVLPVAATLAQGPALLEGFLSAF
jgi:hypothetical protein